MNFLEELENDKKKEPKSNNKTQRELWESCFKYFKHFVSILQKSKDNYFLDFNFVFLDLIKTCKIVGPYEIDRSHIDGELKLKMKLGIEIQEPIKINRSDIRSAEIMKVRLAKDGIFSTITNISPTENFIELNTSITSVFTLVLTRESEFVIKYNNICSSAKRIIKLPIEKIDEEYMDTLAKYIMGKNPQLYTESISDKEVAEIRKKIKFEKQKQKQIDQVVKTRIKQEKELEDLRIANTLKEKSKRYITSQSELIKEKSKSYITSQSSKIKNKFFEKINNFKNKE